MTDKRQNRAAFFARSCHLFQPCFKVLLVQHFPVLHFIPLLVSALSTIILCAPLNNACVQRAGYVSCTLKEYLNSRKQQRHITHKLSRHELIKASTWVTVVEAGDPEATRERVDIDANCQLSHTGTSSQSDLWLGQSEFVNTARLPELWFPDRHDQHTSSQSDTEHKRLSVLIQSPLLHARQTARPKPCTKFPRLRLWPLTSGFKLTVIHSV